MKNNILALIPARSGSKRIKNKNIVKIGNHPLVSYSIAAAKACSQIDDIYVTTDSIKIQKIAIKYGAKAPFLRPKSISKDTSIDIEFFNHFINYLKMNKLQIPDLIIHLSPTVPFRDKNIITKAINYIKKHPDSTSLRSVNEFNVSPYKIFKMKGKYLKGFFPEIKQEYYNLPKQIFPKTFLPNGQVDIIKPKKIKKNKLHGNKLLSFTTGPSLDIDHKSDLLKLNKFLLDKRFNYLNKYLK